MNSCIILTRTLQNPMALVARAMATLAMLVVAIAMAMALVAMATLAPVVVALAMAMAQMLWL